MSSVAVKALAAIVAGATSVVAHGHVTGINVAGTWYEGYDPTSFPYMSDPPTVVGWTASDTDNGFVAPDAYASGDIICHKSAKNAQGYATAKAGDTIEVYWNTWPSSHKGPVLDYLAKCPGNDCTTADKTALEFFKIDAVGLVSASADTWAADQLISNNNSWVLQIPSTLASGNYVLRHEIIALHSAESADGAQNYPQCFNLAITGTGDLEPSGTLGEALYKQSDAGIVVNIYNSLTSYEIPGPAQIAAGTNLVQSAIPIIASASAVTSLSGAIGAGAATPSAAQTTPTGQAAASGAAAETPSAVAPAASAAASQTSSAPAAATSTAKSCKKRRHARDVARH
ncbi:endoglucanase [Diaporthe helianthi]|uniref:lytic cellulose monooxygenase (C4-dehydrogenating) n=1 Tax=Diaporthe helianthi TaxID=158607 RepID=A0A2P5HYU1_DIAHE|nr:endoglucanase [Diaporthe helianthi]